MLSSINRYLNKDEYEKKRTPSELNKWVQEVELLNREIIRETERNKRHKILDTGLGKKFQTEVVPLNYLVQHYFSDRTDIRVEPLSGNESTDACIYQKEGKELLYEVQITEAVDGGERARYKQRRQKGKTFPLSDGTIDYYKKGLNCILQNLGKKFDSMVACDTQTLLILAFDDSIAFRPDDDRTAEERASLIAKVSEIIHSKKPNIDKLVLVGWNCKSFYEFPVNKKP
jgi:hypothetical protein